MKRIGIITCRRVGLTCSRGACLKAFNAKTKYFERYKDEEVELTALFDCSGCDADKFTDPGYLKKLNKLKDNGITVVHIGSHCIGSKCPRREDIFKSLEDHGFEIVDGTH